jgi:mono/diheme cytochrome c family protein
MSSSPTVADAVSSALFLLMLVAVPSAPAAPPQHPGRELYLRYCGACHGAEAKGDGVVGTFMRLKPPDLTQLAAQHGGEFPLAQVVRAIDGREVPRAHGDPAMPVWGQVLSEELGSGTKRHLPVERRVQGRILSIAEYLQSIQVK